MIIFIIVTSLSDFITSLGKSDDRAKSGRALALSALPAAPALLPCCVPVEGEKAQPLSDRLHRCNVKGVVSRVTCEKVLNAFLLEPSVLSTREAVGATRQVSSSMCKHY